MTLLFSAGSRFIGRGGPLHHLQRVAGGYCHRLPSVGSLRFHYAYDGPGRFHHHPHDDTTRRDFRQRGYTVGIGGPVGSGKTALVLEICKHLHASNVAVVTNDIFTQEDAEFLQRQGALPAERIRAVETGGCPHAAIREDVSSNLSALEELTQQFDAVDDDANNALLLLCESGGDNLAANFSRELADLTLYVIDVAGGDKVPRKGGPGITQSDLLIINKKDLAPAVGADLDVMLQDANRMRRIVSKKKEEESAEEVGPTILASVKHGDGVPEICQFILDHFQRAVRQ